LEKVWELVLVLVLVLVSLSESGPVSLLAGTVSVPVSRACRHAAE
jgi:hypothetical protein